jgi:hypothetical protein
MELAIAPNANIGFRVAQNVDDIGEHVRRFLCWLGGSLLAVVRNVRGNRRMGSAGSTVPRETLRRAKHAPFGLAASLPEGLKK